MKIRIKFQKQGTVRFIGHLDVMRYFQKVMRRAEVDIRYSEGFRFGKIHDQSQRSIKPLLTFDYTRLLPLAG